MEVGFKFPSNRAGDARIAVTLREPGSPWTLRFYFLRLEDDETGETSLPNVAFEIGEHFAPDVVSFEDDPPEVDPTALQRTASRYPAYRDLAREHLRFFLGAAKRSEAVLSGERVKPARIDDTFLRYVAAEYEQLRDAGAPSPLQQIATAYRVNKSNASRWLKRAREKGFLDDGKEASDGK